MIRSFGLALALLIVPSTAGGAQLPIEILDFEELAPKCVARTALGDFGSGPIKIEGISKTLDRRLNAAVVIDTAHPEADDDLRTRRHHNAVILSRLPPTKPSGPEAAWVAGSVKHVDDDPVPGGVLRFDFEAIGPVTFYGLTLIDHDDRKTSLRIFREADAGEVPDAPAPPLDLTWGRKPWLRLNWFSPVRRHARLVRPTGEEAYVLEIAPIPVSGEVTKVDVTKLRARGRKNRSVVGRGPLLPGGIPDVSRVEVELGGSSAVDRIVFRPQRAERGSTGEGIFEKIQSYVVREIKPRLDDLEAKFSASWRELTRNPTPALRSGLDNLLARLEQDLIGTLAEDGTRTGGLLQCPELECGCPQLRALQAWVEVEVRRMREDLANASETELMTLTRDAGEEVQIAALEPAAYLASMQGGGRVELAQRAGDDPDCVKGSFGDRLECRFSRLFSVPDDVIKSGEIEVRLPPDPACQTYRLRPMNASLSLGEIGVVPGEPRLVPRDRYCVLCTTADDRHDPRWKLDLLKDKSARREPLERKECQPAAEESGWWSRLLRPSRSG